MKRRSSSSSSSSSPAPATTDYRKPAAKAQRTASPLSPRVRAASPVQAQTPAQTPAQAQAQALALAQTPLSLEEITDISKNNPEKIDLFKKVTLKAISELPENERTHIEGRGREILHIPINTYIHNFKSLCIAEYRNLKTRSEKRIFRQHNIENPLRDLRVSFNPEKLCTSMKDLRNRYTKKLNQNTNSPERPPTPKNSKKLAAKIPRTASTLNQRARAASSVQVPTPAPAQRTGSLSSLTLSDLLPDLPSNDDNIETELLSSFGLLPDLPRVAEIPRTDSPFSLESLSGFLINEEDEELKGDKKPAAK